MNIMNFILVYNFVFVEIIVWFWRICFLKKLNKLFMFLFEKIFIKVVIYFLCMGVDIYGIIYLFIVLIIVV